MFIPPLVPEGGILSLSGEGVGVVPVRTRGQTLWYSRYIYVRVGCPPPNPDHVYDAVVPLKTVSRIRMSRFGVVTGIFSLICTLHYTACMLVCSYPTFLTDLTPALQIKRPLSACTVANGQDKRKSKITPAGSLSSCQPGGSPCWASPLTFGLIGQDKAICTFASSQRETHHYIIL